MSSSNALIQYNPTKQERREEPKRLQCVSEGMLIELCRKEGIDFSKVRVSSRRWFETAVFKEGVRSALVRPDLILRSDNSVVMLDVLLIINFSKASLKLAKDHLSGKSNPDNLDWDDFVSAVTEFPAEKLAIV